MDPAARFDTASLRPRAPGTHAPDCDADVVPAGRQRLWKAAFVAVGLYLLSPALMATHPEGFTAMIQNAAAAANAGMIERSNILYPLHAEYFYLTRVGVVYLLQAAMKLAGNTGDGSFFALTLASDAVFIAATLAVVRRRGGLSPWWGAAAFLMTPGLVELGFYYNDNLVSAACGMVGLALIPPASPASDTTPSRRRPWSIQRATASGVALGYAILCRPDAILLLPVAAAFCFLDHRDVKSTLWTLVPIGAGLAIIFAISSAWGGSSILQSVQETREFLQIHGFRRPVLDFFVVMVYAVGLPQLLVLLPIGAVVTWRDGGPDRRSRRAVLLLLPALLLLYVLPNAQQVRHFYPLLAPFVVLLGARALHALATCRDGRVRLARRWFVAAVLVLWLTPPFDVPLRDGPRFPIGRLWSPLVWREFDNDVNQNLASADAVAAYAATLPTLTVLTVQYDSDHYLQRALWRQGYLPHAASEFFPQCGGGFEVWRRPAGPGRPGGQVLHVRTENAHVNQRPLSYTEAIQLQRGFACEPVLRNTPILASSLFFRTEAWTWLPEVRPEAVQSTRSYGYRPTPVERLSKWVGGAPRGLLAHNFLSRNRVVLLTPADVGQLKHRVDEVVEAHRMEVPPYLRTYDGIMGLFVARVAWPQIVDGRTRWRPVPTPVIPLPGPDDRVPE